MGQTVPGLFSLPSSFSQGAVFQLLLEEHIRNLKLVATR